MSNGSIDMPISYRDKRIKRALRLRREMLYKICNGKNL